MSEFQRIMTIDEISAMHDKIWNAAIEAAVNKIEALGSHSISHEVRKLKK